MKRFLFLFLLTLISCKEPQQNNPQKIAPKVVVHKIISAPEIPKETKIDSISKELMGAWINIEYLNYLDKYGTAHQALKEIDDFLALCIDYKNRKGNRFSIDYIPTRHGGEPFLAYFHLDSVRTKNGYKLVDDSFKDKDRFLNWRNDTIQISVKTSKGFQKLYFKRMLVQDSFNYISSFDGIDIANRNLFSDLSFELFSAEEKKLSSNVLFTSTGQVLNWTPYESFGLSAYHATKYLNNDALRLWSAKDNKPIVFYVEKKGKKWMLYERSKVQFVREEVSTKGKLLFILKQKNKMTSTSVLWGDEYFDLEIPSKYDSCQMVIYDKHLEQDSVETTSEMGCSIVRIPFKLTHVKLDSVRVEQARLESISISQPPLDGFDSAILNELVLQSNWVSYKKKNEMYVPFPWGDSRFIMKEKPELSTEFITDLLKASNKKIAARLLTEFMKTDQQTSWERCTVIIRITGVNNKGERIAKYIIDNELCMQC
jgi:hypothetical protein